MMWAEHSSTLTDINNVLLISNWKFVFFRFELSFDLPTCVTERAGQRYQSTNFQLLIKKTLFITTSVVCVMQTMSASRVVTYINVWRSINDQQSAIMCRTSKDPETIERSFKSLKKCQSKLDCLIFEMLFIRELVP